MQRVNIETAEVLKYYTLMNSCCQKAKKYLKNIDDYANSEVRDLVDTFNLKIKDYSKNGISTFLLECLEVCLELSKSIGYRDGEAFTLWLKGEVLFLGGHYLLSLKNYNRSLKLVNKEDSLYFDIKRSLAYTQFCLGDLCKSLEFVSSFAEKGNLDRVNTVLSGILKCRGENELSYSVIGRVESSDPFELLYKINSLLCLNRVEDAEKLLIESEISLLADDDFFNGYIETLKLRIMLYRGDKLDLVSLESLEAELLKKRSFYHYVDGILNIAEIYIKSGNLKKGEQLLTAIKRDKRDLKVLDCRLYKLLEQLCLEVNDYKGAYNNSSVFSGIIKDRNDFYIGKYLRDLSPYLYSTSKSAV